MEATITPLTLASKAALFALRDRTYSAWYLASGNAADAASFAALNERLEALDAEIALRALWDEYSEFVATVGALEYAILRREASR